MKHLKVLTALIISICCSYSLAASVASIKGTRAIINLDGSFVSIGDQFFLINPASRKKVAIIQIQQIKSDKALAVVLKGSGRAGYTLLAKSSGLTSEPAMTASPSTEVTSESSTSTTTTTGPRSQMGYLFGYMQNSMQATISYAGGSGAETANASMSGTGFSLGGFYDYVFTPKVFLQGLAAYEQFTVAGTTDALACRNSTACNANISYLSFYALAKWYAGDSRSFPWWVGGGGAYMLALSKSASALNENDISVNQALTLAGGMDFSLSNDRYIPVSLSYNYFPDSATVKASSLVIRVGYSYGH